MKEAAEVIINFKKGILESWRNAVNEEIPASGETNPLILINILPEILNDLANIMERHENYGSNILQEDCKEVMQESIDHGRHRAASSHYTAEQIIKEYIVFHRVLIEALREKDAYNEEVGILLSYALEMSMSYSIGSFTDSIQDMRVKLVGTLAHDIRNPLSAAHLAMDMLKYEDGEERFDKVKEMISRSLRRSIDLVEDLLNAISVQAGEGISLNFAEMNIVEEVKLVCWEAAESYSNDIQFHCDEEEIIGIFDGTAVRRLLENLVTNAAKHGAKDEPISVIVEQDMKKVILKVHNKGNSISKEDQKDIFKFLKHNNKKLNGTTESWGIGLTFVRMAAEAHGGHVEIDSDEEKGTIFTIALLKDANKPGKKKAKVNLSDAPV